MLSKLAPPGLAQKFVNYAAETEIESKVSKKCLPFRPINAIVAIPLSILNIALCPTRGIIHFFAHALNGQLKDAIKSLAMGILEPLGCIALTAILVVLVAASPFVSIYSCIKNRKINIFECLKQTLESDEQKRLKEKKDLEEKNTRLAKNVTDLNGKVDQLKLAALEVRNKALEENAETLKQAKAQLTLEKDLVAAAALKTTQLQARMTQLENDNSVLVREKNSVTAQAAEEKEKASTTINTLQGRVTASEKTQEELSGAVASKAEEISRITAALKEASVTISTLEGRVTASKKAQEELSDEVASKAGEISRIAAGLKEASVQAQAMETQLAEKEEKIKENALQISTLEQSLAEADRKMTDIGTEKLQLEKALAELNQFKEQLVSRNTELTGRVQAYEEIISQKDSEKDVAIASIRKEHRERMRKLQSDLKIANDHATRLTTSVDVNKAASLRHAHAVSSPSTSSRALAGAVGADLTSTSLMTPPRTPSTSTASATSRSAPSSPTSSTKRSASAAVVDAVLRSTPGRTPVAARRGAHSRTPSADSARSTASTSSTKK